LFQRDVQISLAVIDGLHRRIQRGLRAYPITLPLSSFFNGRKGLSPFRARAGKGHGADLDGWGVDAEHDSRRVAFAEDGAYGGGDALLLQQSRQGGHDFTLESALRHDLTMEERHLYGNGRVQRTAGPPWEILVKRRHRVSGGLQGVVQIHPIESEPDIGKQPGIVQLLRGGLNLRLAYGDAWDQACGFQQFRLACL